MKCFFRIFLLLLVYCSSLFAFSLNSKDGNWWNELNPDKKYDYIVGFLDGMDLGFYFSYIELKEKETHAKVIRELINSYNQNKSKLFNKITYREIIEEIDSFYSGTLNLAVRARIAIYIALMRIAKMDESEINSILHRLKNLKEK